MMQSYETVERHSMLLSDCCDALLKDAAHSIALHIYARQGTNTHGCSKTAARIVAYATHTDIALTKCTVSYVTTAVQCKHTAYCCST
jgi:hypothetical protein